MATPSLLPRLVSMHAQAVRIVDDLEALICQRTLDELEQEADRRVLEQIASYPGWRFEAGELRYSAAWLDDKPRLGVVR